MCVLLMVGSKVEKLSVRSLVRTQKTFQYLCYHGTSYTVGYFHDSDKFTNLTAKYTFY